MRSFIDPDTGLARLDLARLPTPLEPAPRLAARTGLGRLDIKREDLSGVALGGNKLRQIDFLLAAALRTGADTLVTAACSQSNFCRALAGACAQIGLSCHLLLRNAGGRTLQGNLLLDHLFGATLSWTSATDPWDPTIRSELDRIVAQLRAAGRRPWLVQLPGETAGLGAVGWAAGAAELARDFAAIGRYPDVLAVACGSGLTCAGLALGMKHLRLPTRVVGISVQQQAGRLLPWMVDAGNRAAALMGWDTRLEVADVTLTDDQIAPGHGRASAASLAAVRLAGREAGLVLDPVYTGKALAGLIALVQGDSIAAGAHAVFVHSGGAPGLFHHAADFAT